MRNGEREEQLWRLRRREPLHRQGARRRRCRLDVGLRPRRSDLGPDVPRKRRCDLGTGATSQRSIPASVAHSLKSSSAPLRGRSLRAMLRTMIGSSVVLATKSLSIAFLAGMAICATSVADARPDTRAMTCEQTQALIKSHRSVVLTTGRNTYDRYVRRVGNECDAPDAPTAASVPTRDGQCRVYRCQEPTYNRLSP